MRARTAERGGPALAILGRLFHVLPKEHEPTIGTRGAQRDPSIQEPSVLTALAPLEAPASASGVIRHEEVPLLARYDTSYGLFDEWICDYACVLVSDAYRLDDYVGDSVWVSGPLRGVIGGMPVMKVTRLELLRLKWMR
jgi:hypothetical protein